ncbi:MAG: permease [bacterium]
MKGFSLFILGALLTSFLADPSRTLEGLRRGAKMFLKLMPTLLTLVVLMSLALYLIPASLVVHLLGEGSGMLGWFLAGALGSILLIPGFIAYPLCSTLLKQGAAIPVIALFITTLMMVGVLTLPLESRYFGIKAALMRNGLSLLGAILVALLMALSYAIF